MGSLATMIGLDLKLCATRAVGGLVGADAAVAAGAGRLEMLKESVRCLEEERRKIEVFRRELPLCTRILADVIEGMKKEMEECRMETSPGHCEKVVPAKREFEEEDEAKVEADCKEKKKWLSTAQLWSNNSGENKEDEMNEEEISRGFDGRQPENKKSFLDSKSHRRPGAFVPFKGLKEHGATALPTPKPLPAISLLSQSNKNNPPSLSPPLENRQVFSPVVGGAPAPATSDGHLGLQNQQQPSRKARRCWSVELHRRFVLALEQLGGAQVATPKQIRELMKVDELTNDEVKSHLQKYRLHRRRVSGASAGTKKISVVEGESSWPTVFENYSGSSEQSLSKSGSPESPLQLTGSDPTLSITARDSSEEDGKSESSIWTPE